MLIPLARGESGASDAAVAHLINVARNRVELERDTALAPGTTKEKQSIIRSQLKQLSSIVDEGELRAVDEKIAGGLAAVLISRVIDYDTSQVQVLAVAMLKRDDRWIPAPVLASFENSGITYLPGLAESARQLEAWMLRERTIHLTRLRKDVQADLLADIRKSGNIDELRQSSPAKIVDNFIEACRARDLPAALVYLGGLEDPLPRNWDNILQFISSNIRQSKKDNDTWRRLTDTTGARAFIETDTFDDGAMVSLGEFAPSESTPGQAAVTIFHFPLDRSKDDIWRLRLPTWLLDLDLPGSPDASDSEMIKAFPAKLLEHQPKLSFTKPEELMESLQQALSSPRFEAVLPHIGVPESGDALPVLERAARLWRDFRGHDSKAPLLLEVRKEDDQACALLSIFDARNPQIRSILIKRIFLQQKDGLWTIPSSGDETPDGAAPELIAWAEKSSRLSEADWLSRLGLTATLGGIPADSAPSEEDALAAAHAWLTAIQSRDPRAILRSVAAFDDKRGIKKLFRTIGHELQSDHRTEILKIHRNGRWAAVSTHAISEQRSEDPYHLLYPIVSTESGPRVLAEALLFHADTRSREFLNSSIWNRLDDRLPEAAVAELKEIQKAHTALAESP